MTSRFRKGQLVAVRYEHFGPHCSDDCWYVAVYLRKVKDKFYCRVLPAFSIGSKDSCWRECKPVQDVWPWLKELNARIIDDE